MNSLQKQTIPVQGETHEAFLIAFEANLLKLNGVEDVELMYKKLQHLGLHFDPFGPEVTSECQQVMDGPGLTPHLKNPYLGTNILLRLLDKTEERLNNLKQ